MDPESAPDRPPLAWPPKIGRLVLLHEEGVIRIVGRVMPYADGLRPEHHVAIKCTDQITRHAYPGQLYPYHSGSTGRDASGSDPTQAGGG